MKKTLLLLLVISFTPFISGISQTTVSMGAGYANDIYFSMNNGTVATVDRTGWDLGFYTSPWSAGIITNGGAGIELRSYPLGDTAAWMSIDTNGMAAWPILYNGEDSWENGAFNRHSTDHPDYGWGKYNAQSHDVIGDSLYVIKLQDGTYKKIWIVRKISIENKYIFRIADIDHSNETELILENNSYTDVNFSYFSFADESFFNREPATDTWDILFTKYQGLQPQGVPYPVVGVLNNVTCAAKRYHPVTIDYSDWYAEPMDSLKAVVGWDWKYFDMGTFSWTLEDSLVFFVNPADSNIYKLYFTDYAGTASGDITFMSEKVSNVSINEISLNEANLTLAPNPANTSVNMRWDLELQGDISIHVYDLGGKELLRQELNSSSLHEMQYRLDVSKLNQGMYVVSLVSGKAVINEKLVIE